MAILRVFCQADADRYKGHRAAECKANRVVDMSNIPNKSPEEAWNLLKAADAEGDLDDFREVTILLAELVGELDETLD